MTTPLCDMVSEIQIGMSTKHERLTVVPLTIPRTSDLDYVFLGQGVDQELIQIEEVSKQGHVPELKITNRGKRSVLVFEGETLIGGKQHRVVNLSVLVGGRSQAIIPVSCVESGRWRFMSPLLSPSEYCDSAMRAILCQGTSAGLKSAQSPSPSQAAVWGHVEYMLACSGSDSPTRAYHKVYEDLQARLADYQARLCCPENANGVAVQVEGELAMVDLFDKPATLRELWPKLVRSYATAALTNGRESGRATDVREFLERGVSGEVSSYQAAGIGATLRLSAEGSFGSALVSNDRLVHLALFATLNGKTAPRDTAE